MIDFDIFTISHNISQSLSLLNEASGDRLFMFIVYVLVPVYVICYTVIRTLGIEVFNALS